MAAAQRIREVDGVKDGWMDGWVHAPKGERSRLERGAGCNRRLWAKLSSRNSVRPYVHGRKDAAPAPGRRNCNTASSNTTPRRRRQCNEIQKFRRGSLRFADSKLERRHARPAGLTGGRGFGSGGRMAAWPELPSPEMAIVTTSKVDSGGERKERLYCRPILTMTAHAL